MREERKYKEEMDMNAGKMPQMPMTPEMPMMPQMPMMSQMPMMCCPFLMNMQCPMMQSQDMCGMNQMMGNPYMHNPCMHNSPSSMQY